MTNIKLTAISILLLSATIASAGSMGPICARDKVHLPCPNAAFDAGIEALYLQPVYDADVGYYSALRTNYLPVGDNFDFRRHEPAWGWAFKAQGSYHFSTGNDLALDWYHFQRSRSREHLFSRDFVTPRVFSDFYLVAENNNQWDAVHLEFGQNVDVGIFKTIRFHAGGQYAFIKKQEETGSQVRTLPANILTAQMSSLSKFNGFGPRIGLDMFYNWGDVSLYGRTAASLLVGKSQFSGAFYPGPFSNIASFAVSGSKLAAVPELEAKLGATYTYTIDECAFTLDFGYLWINYFNGIHGMANGASTIVESDFALHGPYLEFKWVGSV